MNVDTASIQIELEYALKIAELIEEKNNKLSALSGGTRKKAAKALPAPEKKVAKVTKRKSASQKWPFTKTERVENEMNTILKLLDKKGQM